MRWWDNVKADRQEANEAWRMIRSDPGLRRGFATLSKVAVFFFLAGLCAGLLIGTLGGA